MKWVAGFSGIRSMGIFEHKGFILATACLAIFASITWLAPRYVIHKNADRYAQLFLDCEEAKFSAQSLRKFKESLTPRTAKNLQKTLNIEMITCFEVVALATEMRERGVKRSSLDRLEIQALTFGAGQVSQLGKQVEKQQKSWPAQ